MDWKKIAPWNWFKHEQESRPFSRAVMRPDAALWGSSPLDSEFESLFEAATRRLFSENPSLASSSGMLPSPIPARVDISEGPKAYTVRAELPGVEIDDVSVEADRQKLVLRAEKKQEKDEEDEGYHCVERSYGSVQRVLSLPDDANVDAIEARFKNGVLRLRIPKHPPRATEQHRIEIGRG